MLNDLLIAFGVNSGVIPKLWQKPDVGVANESESVARTRRLSPIYATLDHYKSQMLPGERLDKFINSATRSSATSVTYFAGTQSTIGLEQNRVKSL